MFVQQLFKTSKLAGKIKHTPPPTPPHPIKWLVPSSDRLELTYLAAYRKGETHTITSNCN